MTDDADEARSCTSEPCSLNFSNTVWCRIAFTFAVSPFIKSVFLDLFITVDTGCLVIRETPTLIWGSVKNAWPGGGYEG